MPTLGKYEIYEQLGTGSMGTVYRARDTVIQRDVALKTIRTGADIEPEMRERFYREARACGRLQHPNIVTIYDLGEQDRTAYIAMELLEGADFRKVIEERQVDSLPDKLELMIQICEALGHAHRHGVIHRDVKPSNIVLAGPKCIKVLDFGIARLPSSRLTVAGNVLGTPNYMAPEQILAKPCDSRTDLFSAGVVFFEFVTGQHPFRGSLIPRRIVESEPDSLFDHDSSLPVLLEKVFARALAKQPEQRYPTGAAFAADLRAVLDALRQNSSPTFSRIILPSERAAPAPVAPAAVAKEHLTLMRAPGGEDSAEWRYSQVLGLIPLFEEALDSSDAPAAQRHFESLERVTAGDERFDEAVNGCRARLEKIRSSAEPTPNPKPTSTRICIQCGAANRMAARFCIQCGSDLNDEEEQKLSPLSDSQETQQIVTSNGAPNTASLPNDADTIFDRTTLQLPHDFPKPPVPSENPSAPSAPLTTRVGLVGRAQTLVRTHPRKVIGGIAAIVLIAVGLVALILLLTTKYPEEHAVAIAKANKPKVEIFESASPTSRALYSVGSGEQIRILEVPGSHSQDWVHVQVVQGGKPKRPGFVHQYQLGEWKGLEAPAAFFICCAFEFPATTDEEFEKRKYALDGLMKQFPGTAEATAAATEKARLHLESVKVHRTQGLEGEMLRSALNSAREEAANLGESGRSMVAEIDEMQQQASPGVATKGDQTKADQPKDEPPKDLEIADMLRLARSNLNRGKLPEAKYWVDTVLKSQPNNQEARLISKQIKDVREIDGQYERH